MKPEISMIIPVYNSEKYLHRCLDSVLQQSFRDIEVICVDDGSEDGSAKILDEYASLDDRIRVIHKENGGATSARKAGAAIAAGKYIGCVDSDDWIDAGMFERLYQIAERERVDLVTCGFYLEGNYTTVHMDMVEEGRYGIETIQKLRENTLYRLDRREAGIRGSLWCKLFKTDLFQQVQNHVPDELILAEDKVCLMSYILECNSAYVLKEAYYHWGMHIGSMSRSNRNDYLLKINSVYNYFIGLYSHPNFTSIMRSQAEIYITELLIMGINQRMGFQNQNMIWIDPYWMENIPANAAVVFYGAGALGEKYKKQLVHSRPDVRLTGCVDPQYRKLSNDRLKVESPEALSRLSYDFVVITMKNKGKAESVKDQLMELGISEEKIIWCEQPEVYWKYIEAEGIVQAGGEDI